MSKLVYLHHSMLAELKGVCVCVGIWFFFACVFLYSCCTVFLWLGLIVPGPENVAHQSIVSRRKVRVCRQQWIKEQVMRKL